MHHSSSNTLLIHMNRILIQNVKIFRLPSIQKSVYWIAEKSLTLFEIARSVKCTQYEIHDDSIKSDLNKRSFKWRVEPSGKVLYVVTQSFCVELLEGIESLSQSQTRRRKVLMVFKCLLLLLHYYIPFASLVPKKNEQMLTKMCVRVPRDNCLKLDEIRRGDLILFKSKKSERQITSRKKLLKEKLVEELWTMRAHCFHHNARNLCFRRYCSFGLSFLRAKIIRMHFHVVPWIFFYHRFIDRLFRCFCYCHSMW